MRSRTANRATRWSRRSGNDPRAPHEAEERPRAVLPQPETPFEDLWAEMVANDPEFHEWQAAESRAEWAARGHRR